MNNNKVHSLNVLFFFFWPVYYLQSIEKYYHRTSSTRNSANGFRVFAYIHEGENNIFYENDALKYFKNHFGRRSQYHSKKKLT